MGVQSWWKKMDKTSNGLEQMDYDMELISETKKISPDKSQKSCLCFISILLCGSVLLICIQTAILYFHVLDVLDSNEPSEHLMKPTMLKQKNDETSLNPIYSLESLKMLVSLVRNLNLKKSSFVLIFLLLSIKKNEKREAEWVGKPPNVIYFRFV